MSDQQYVNDYERALIERAKSGDTRAFEQLIKPYIPRMTHQMRRYFKREEDAADAMQEHLLAVYRRLHTFEYRSQFSSWLHGACARNSLEHMQRRVKPHWHLSIDGPADADISCLAEDCTTSVAGFHNYHGDGEDPASLLEAKQQLEAIQAALNELPEALSRAFLLREIDQLSYEEIAEELGCTVGTVSSRIHRARQAIFEALGLPNHQ